MALDGVNGDIAAMLRAQAEARRDAPAILAPGEPTLTYGQLATWLEQAALDLRHAGVTPTSRVAVLMQPGPEAALATLAVMCTAICVPVNPESGSDDLESCLSDTGAAFVVTHDDATPSPATRQLQRVTFRRAQGSLTGTLLPAVPAAVAGTPANSCAFNDADAVALLLQTSGTTARPKQVPLTHRNVLASARANAACFGLGPTDRCVNVLSLLHIGGLVHGLLTTLASGGSVVCPRGFDAGGFFRLVVEFAPTWYTGTPTIHLALLPFLDDYRRLAPGHRFRFLRSASAPMPAALIERLESAFDAPLIEGYGMTEAGRITCNPLPPARRKPGSVGLPVALEVRVVDADGVALPPGQPGEVTIRGASVTSGYLDDPAANAAAFRNGWLRTGDLGHFDADGYLFLTGRIKELINRGGKKIAPREIDEALLALPGVREAAAFGVPHASLGEDLMAAVVAEPGATLDGDALRHELLARLARHKVPSAVVVLDRLPRGPTGKVQRSALPQLLDDLRPTSSRRFGNAEEEAVARIFGSVLEIEVPSAQDNFFLLGGDSLSAARTVARLQTELGLPTQIGIPLLFEFPTVSKLAAELARLRLDPQADDALLARIAELSDEEVERMLMDDSVESLQGLQANP